MQLGVGDDEVVTARTARVSPALLNIQHVEVPEPQVVGEHVQLGQEGGPGLVDGGNLVETVEIYDGLLPEEDLEELHDGPQRVLQQLRLLQGGEGVTSFLSYISSQNSTISSAFMFRGERERSWRTGL